MAHFGGGALLALGLVTRLAAAIQVPALVGAVFFVHIHDGLMSQSQSLELAVLVLFMLLVFMVFGAGRLSLDRYLFGVDVPDTAKKKPIEATNHEPTAQPGPSAAVH
jgi:uncharacterized membrane protein YphA (DoxX/SURF4 family)